jgi:hypothetical protein
VLAQQAALEAVAADLSADHGRVAAEEAGDGAHTLTPCVSERDLLAFGQGENTSFPISKPSELRRCHDSMTPHGSGLKKGTPST